MTHLRDITTGHEERIVPRRGPVTYVYVAASLCGLTRPADTLVTLEPGALVLGDVCPDCLVFHQRRRIREG